MKAYLLAAGRGRRAGGPKALKMTDGKSALERQIEFLLTLFKPEDIAVSIQEEWLINCRKLNTNVHWVPVNPDDSPLGSLQSLLRLCPIEDWASLHHVDMPIFDRDVFKTLFAKARGTDAEAVIPSHGGRRGHPVLLSSRLQGELLALRPESGRLDHFLRLRTAEVVEVQASAVLDNRNS